METNKIYNSLEEELNSKYCRESKNVNFQNMARTVLIVAGIGAFALVVEQFARLGIGGFHLFDYDNVEIKNLTSQNFSIEDIGQPKTEALKHRLESCEFEKDNRNIPPLEINTHGDFLAISDEDIQRIIEHERSKGNQVILVMASDYHPVQARGSRIAIKFKIPTFWVGIYRMGMAGEIIFYLPDHDLPCYRCITETRYRYFDNNRLANHLLGDYSGSGLSAGLPMAASYIDSILGHLIIGAIHIDIEDNQHAQLFKRLIEEKRNFIQCQLDPSYKLNDKEDIFSQIKGPDIITFNTIFQQESKKNDCLDCRSFPSGFAWKHTDYTKESYRETIKKFCVMKSESSKDWMYNIH